MIGAQCRRPEPDCQRMALDLRVNVNTTRVDMGAFA
jgi:hypothetical protein